MLQKSDDASSFRTDESMKNYPYSFSVNNAGVAVASASTAAAAVKVSED